MLPTFNTPNYPFSYPVASIPPHLALADAILQRAIEYGNQHESPARIDEALKLGAQLNCNDFYSHNALVLAVRLNRPWAISSLMMRGAEIPRTPADGVDLLMEACRDSHLEMARALIEVAKMNVSAIDASGKTALHYAVIAGSEEITQLLLENGASPNVYAHAISAFDLLDYFGHTIVLSGKAVTPLMIATASGGEKLVQTLLDAGAKPDAGGCSPLILAAQHGYRSIFDALLAHGAKLNSCQGANGSTGLFACIESRMPVDYLAKLIPQHDFSDDDGTIHSPLGSAIGLNATDVVALLMISGAPVESHLASDEPTTIWDLAVQAVTSSPVFCNLMTARVQRIFQANDPEKVSALLQEIVELSGGSAGLASAGIFISNLSDIRDKLWSLKQASPQMTELQCAMEAAWIISKSVSVPSSGPVIRELTEEDDSLPPHESWQRQTERKVLDQRRDLSAACATMLEHGLDELKASTNLQFFLQCDRECPENQQIAEFIKIRLAEKSGAPTSVVRLVRNAWIKAAKWTMDWQVAPDENENGNRFLLALAQNLILKELDDFDGDHTDLVDECMAALRQAIPLESHPLSQFCSSPVIWLRKFENRNSLADPDEALPSRLQIELGLPHATCEAIVKVWQRTLRSARTGEWDTPEKMQAYLKRKMAISISEALMSDGGDKIVPASANLMLQHWRAKTISPRATPEGPRKRPAGSEAPDAPPRKDARHT